MTCKTNEHRTARTYDRQSSLPGRTTLDAVRYAAKFDTLAQIAAARAAGEDSLDVLVVAHPSVLGDTYEELIQSLSLLAEAGLDLAIADPQPGTFRMQRINRARQAVSGRALSTTTRGKTHDKNRPR